MDTKLELDSFTRDQLFSVSNSSFKGDYDDFLDGRVHVLTRLPTTTSIVSNFGQHNDLMFWQMTTNTSLYIEYDRSEMKPLKHQWNKLIGPVSLSGVDLFNVQFDCINGNIVIELILSVCLLRPLPVSTWLSRFHSRVYGH